MKDKLRSTQDSMKDKFKETQDKFKMSFSVFTNKVEQFRNEEQNETQQNFATSIMGWMMLMIESICVLSSI